MLIGAIDPGVNGALAYIDGDGIVTTWAMPTLKMLKGKTVKHEIDAHALANIMWGKHADHYYVEAVGAMPGQGVTSMFSFGRSFGVVIGVIAAINVPMTLVPPRTWKAALGVNASKDGSRARASQLYPAYSEQWRMKKDEGRAEATLLAHYGRSLNAQLKAMMEIQT